MAKMFYSLDEAADRLGKSADELKQMAERGELQEYRGDDDQLIFKVEQVDLLAGDDESSGGDSMIPLADSSEQSALGLGGSALGLEDTGGADALSGGGGGAGGGAAQSGISVFDAADDLDDADPAAVTQVSDEPLDAASLESFGSGSGLMDLTRESDDTSLGAEGLLDELYSGDETMAAGTETVGESGLFEGDSTSSPLGEELSSGGPAVAAAPEVVDGAGSGLVGGLSIGMIVAAGLGLATVLMGVFGVLPFSPADLPGGEMSILILMGAMLGVALLLGGVGWVLGKR